MTRPDEVVKDQPVEVLAAALAGQNLWHGRHATSPAGSATAKAILAALTDSGFALLPLAEIERRDALLREAIRGYRKNYGLSLRGLADSVGVDFTHLSKIENGHDAPSRELVERIDREVTAHGDLVALYDGLPCSHGRYAATLTAPNAAAFAEGRRRADADMAAMYVDVRACIEIADRRVAQEFDDNTVTLRRSDWNRIVAVSRGYKSRAAEGAIQRERERWFSVPKEADHA